MALSSRPAQSSPQASRIYLCYILITSTTLSPRARMCLHTCCEVSPSLINQYLSCQQALATTNSPDSLTPAMSSSSRLCPSASFTTNCYKLPKTFIKCAASSLNSFLTLSVHGEGSFKKCAFERDRALASPLNVMWVYLEGLVRLTISAAKNQAPLSLACRLVAVSRQNSCSSYFLNYSTTDCADAPLSWVILASNTFCLLSIQTSSPFCAFILPTVVLNSLDFKYYQYSTGSSIVVALFCFDCKLQPQHSNPKACFKYLATPSNSSILALRIQPSGNNSQQNFAMRLCNSTNLFIQASHSAGKVSRNPPLFICAVASRRASFLSSQNITSTVEGSVIILLILYFILNQLPHAIVQQINNTDVSILGLEVLEQFDQLRRIFECWFLQGHNHCIYSLLLFALSDQVFDQLLANLDQKIGVI